jgi:hypothetical protein
MSAKNQYKLAYSLARKFDRDQLVYGYTWDCWDRGVSHIIAYWAFEHMRTLRPVSY